MAVRLFLFYVLALGVVAALIPWTQTGGSVAVTESPFVKVLARTGVPQAAGIMNFVIVSAALSGMNTNVYLCSRMLFSLSRGGYAPAILGRLSKAGAPVAATLLSGACILAAAGLAKFTPKAYAYLQGVALFGAITVWVLILVSHIAFRRAHRATDLPVRMPLFPVMQIAGLGLLACARSSPWGWTTDWNLSWMVGVPWLVLLTIAYFLWKRTAAPVAAAVAPPGDSMSQPVRPPSAADVDAARANIQGVALRTPLCRLNADTPGVRIHLKLENLQPLGLVQDPRRRSTRSRRPARTPCAPACSSASAGNFGQGLAWAAREVGVQDHHRRSGRLGREQGGRAASRSARA